MNSSVEEVKAALLNSHHLNKASLYTRYREDKSDPDYHTMFWSARLETKIENESKWKEVAHFHCDSLPEAIARLIMARLYKGTDKQTNSFYDECEVPDNLPNWKPYGICITENISRKEKWGETRESRHASIVYEIKLNRGGWTHDFSEGARDLETALCFVPKRFWNMMEGAIPYNWDYRTNENQQPEDYPFFKYKGHLFKTTYWIPDQKCVCGTSDTYIDEYEDDNSVKVEVWDVDLLEKDIIHYDKTNLFCNGTQIHASSFNDLNLEWVGAAERKELKKAFPESKGFSSWSMSCSWE